MNKIAIILDIDGTLCVSLFDNKGMKFESNEFLEKLSNVEPFPFVKSIIVPVVNEAIRVRVITGRQKFMLPVTMKWLDKVLEMDDYDLISVPFVDYSTYIEQKKQQILDSIAYFDQIQCKTYIYEDDAKIVQWIKDELPDIVLFEVKDGKVKKCSKKI